MKQAIIVAVALCATVGVVEAQVRGGQPGGGGFRGLPNPIGILLENRAELDLTDDQFARLEVIKTGLDQVNAPRLAEIETLRSAAQADQSARERIRPLMTTIRGNQDTAVESAMAVLNEGQRTRAQALIEAARPQRPGGGRPPQP